MSDICSWKLLHRRSLDIHVELLLCWFRKIIFNVETTIIKKKKNFVKFSKPKFISLLGGDDTDGLGNGVDGALCVCVCVRYLLTERLSHLL